MVALNILQVEELYLPQRSNNLRAVIRPLLDMKEPAHQPLYREDLLPFYSVLGKSMSASIP